MVTGSELRPEALPWRPPTRGVVSGLDQEDACLELLATAFDCASRVLSDDEDHPTRSPAPLLGACERRGNRERGNDGAFLASIGQLSRRFITA